MPKNSERTILVTGATGNQGGSALRHLKERGFSLRALARDPDKAQARQLEGHGTSVFRGDLEDRASLENAMDEVYGVFSVQGYTEDSEREVREGVNVADAANRQSISHLVYSSVYAADQNTGIPHFDSKGRIEERVRNTGIPYTILRPVFFMENWSSMLGQQIEQGVIPLPLSPTTKLPMVAVDDIGAFVAMAFEHSGKWQGKTLELAGDELSMNEIAEAFTRVTGREVRYQQVPWDQFEQQAGRELTIMYRWMENGGSPVNISAVRELRPQLLTLNRWLDTHWAQTRTQGA